VEAPNFRPTFKLFTWHLALFGAFLCIFAMFYVSPFYALIAFAFQCFLIALIYFYAPKSSWGDFSEALGSFPSFLNINSLPSSEKISLEN
jgi:solute carrier family 12 (potassium/chloride transporters), member 9